MNKNTAINISCLLLALAVGLGAFGAHALREILTERQLEVWQTGVSYHFYHSIGILLLTLIYILRPNKWLSRAILLLFTGVILFSGSLYLLTTLEWSFLGPVTPIGGVAFIIGWLIAIPGLRQAAEHA